MLRGHLQSTSFYHPPPPVATFYVLVQRPPSARGWTHLAESKADRLVLDQLQAEEVSPPCPESAASEEMQPQEGEYLFELAPLGPGDLLSRCREGPGNWWGEGNEELRVDARGRVVLVDPEMYYEVCQATSTGRDANQPSVF